MQPPAPDERGSGTVPDDPFDAHLREWQEWAEAPWGRIRFAVVGRVLSDHVMELAARRRGPLRVLDVGGGDARGSVPLAVLGHDVTVLDPAPGMLAEARRRAREAGVTLETVVGSVADLGPDPGAPFDLTLCHFVLQYRPADVSDVARLAATLAPGGRLSITAPNPVGRVLMRLTREGPPGAADELAREDMVAATFGTTVRRYPAEEARAEVEAEGLRVVGEYGGRIANDLLVDDHQKLDPAYFDRLLSLELALCDRAPYRDIGAFWQLVAERP